MEIGTGPLDLTAEGYALQVGEPVQVSGYWEDSEFKAAQLVRLSSGEAFALLALFARTVRFEIRPSSTIWNWLRCSPS